MQSRGAVICRIYDLGVGVLGHGFVKFRVEDLGLISILCSRFLVEVCLGVVSNIARESSVYGFISMLRFGDSSYRILPGEFRLRISKP